MATFRFQKVYSHSSQSQRSKVLKILKETLFPKRFFFKFEPLIAETDSEIERCSESGETKLG